MNHFHLPCKFREVKEVIVSEVAGEREYSYSND